MAIPLMAIAIAAKAGGDIWGGVNARNNLRHQATTLNSQARLEEEAAAFNALQTAKQFDELLGEQKLATSISGVEEEGSVLDIFNKTISDKKMSVENILAEGRARASSLRDQAKQTRKAGKRALLGSLVGITDSAAQVMSQPKKV